MHPLLSAVLALVAVPVLRSAAPAAPVAADHAQQMAAGLELFKDGVGALLRENCLECHGGERTRSGFSLATREGLLQGGDGGVVIVAGNAAQSRLLRQLRHEEEPHMPHRRPRLPDADVARLAAWIEAGAPYAEPLVGAAEPGGPPGAVSEQDRAFWSFRPLAAVRPPEVRTRSWARTPVDAFVLARLEERGIRPNATADRRTLVRRAYFDLLGLPPKPEEIAAFLADDSPQAYERLVDRLLASPHHGERWGRHWLDLARYGESHGYEQDYDRPYAYPYRDFVIRALNDDLPFDTFVQWQIAGDELAPDNPQAWFATGFLGAGTHATQITANQAEKERYDELDDKIATIGTAMLGLTVGCARCHDHKFDPIPAQDYYRLLATFTTTVRSEHDVDLDPAATRAALARWEAEHAPLLAALRQYESELLPARREAWLAAVPELPPPDAFLGLTLEGLRAGGPASPIVRTAPQPDGSWLLTVVAGSPETVTFTARTGLTGIRAFRLEALTAPTLPGYGPGWGAQGAFTLTAFSVTAKPRSGGGEAVPLAFVGRREPSEREATGPIVPWGDGGEPGREQAAVFELAQPAGFDGGTELSFTLKFAAGDGRGLLGRLRVSLATGADDGGGADLGALVAAADFEQARALLRKPRAEWTPAELEVVARVHRPRDEEWRRRHDAVLAHEAVRPRPRLVKAMVCSEGLPAVRLHTQGPDFYPTTHFLRRGDLAQKRGEAEPGFLQVLTRAPEGEKRWQVPPPAGARTPQRRAALARWLTDVEHGAGHLLARVIVNRLWQHHLGRGLVATPSDFGATGDAPTHPELLDWLAGELLRQGWRLKPLHRLIMTSAVYRQGGDTDEARRRADPENLLWWHRPPQRLEAEIFRDALLAVSGRLEPALFGPGSLDEGMRRRSVYFFLKRSRLIPMLAQFDAPDTLQGVGRRPLTTVAPQALLLLNSPHVRAAARDFAARLRPAAAQSPAAAVAAAYALALGRSPSAGELADAGEFLAHQASTYAGPDAAERALADFCQAMFALNEFAYVE